MDRGRAPVQISPLMQSLDSLPSVIASEPRSMSNLPDITVSSEQQLTSLKLYSVSEGKSFLLLDENEFLKVSSSEFANRLGCSDASAKVKVVSIVGNSGDGKSFTLNEVFFKGDNVFKTSNEQTSCTIGVWAAFDPRSNVIALDTEGLLGTTATCEVQRTRLLLKVLAVSDVVIYRTKAERLHADMFKFLGSASQAFTRHFRAALGNVNSRGGFGGTLSVLGPAVIIFHETHDTFPLKATHTETVEDVLRTYFSGSKSKTDAFSSLRYIGTQTKRPPTNFSELKDVLRAELSNTSVRSARQADIVYQALKVLNDKFSGEVTDPQPVYFPDEYFTCASKCLSCGRRCEASMGHQKDEQPHLCQQRCCFQAQYNNLVYICNACYANGHQVVVTPSEPSWFDLAKHAWSGYTINCPYCGEIFRSRQYWYGNKDPKDVVRTEYTHVWPGSNAQIANSQNTAQKVLDGVTFISEAVASVGSQPTRYLTSRVADMIAPKYWRPNHEIFVCYCCKKDFATAETKHHCRSCGEGFCEECSSYSRPVPERGWTESVRVCKPCFENKKGTMILPASVDEDEVRARKYGEVVVNTFSSIASVLQYPKELIKDSARPSYWVADCDAKACAICEEMFGPLVRHHCRDCGQAVCHPCSPKQRPVPSRGWYAPVRVCNKCLKED